jgi:adenosylhomocysteine nucleosidase
MQPRPSLGGMDADDWHFSPDRDGAVASAGAWNQKYQSPLREAKQATSQNCFTRVRTNFPYSCVGTRPADDNRQGVLRRLGDVSVVRHFQSVIAVTGLAFEAKIAGGVAVVRDGGRTTATLDAAIARGGRGIMSFGIAGGLAPGLQPGQWVVASTVVSERGRHEVDRPWSERLLNALPGALHAAIAGVDSPVRDALAKRALFVHTGALVVDMESHLAARIAAAHGLPFAACRVIIDPAHRDLPPAALLSLRPNGIPDWVAVLRSVVEQPNQLPGLMRLALDASIARAALRRGRAALGPSLAFPDLTH